ncbi:hypothetical protein SOVF_091100 [Spinacia oleracea]|uniref:Serine-rich protein-like protein n=1 Tax=Spinacia oleracea TaxID=3562 RepID=A0A9R0I7R1_SPIOL|nr:uncharacterized protein LOC110784256 [Spinacia oleracea]KNA16219.1 hypothetical protein SOVF_091100 [Spinacia oleracea]
MAATSSSRHQRSHSPSGRFCASSISSSSSFTSSSPTFTSQSTDLFHRSSSPTRVSIYGCSSPQTTSSSVRFSIDNRPTSPNRSFAAVNRNRNPFPAASGKKKTCMCSPTTHPGSFRCSYHKSLEAKKQQNMVSYPPNRLNMRRSAMTNSLVRIGTVEGGDSVKRALAALIRPCAHQQRRRSDFQPRPSRLSIMSKAGDSDP